MTLKIEINLDNDAFHEDDSYYVVNAELRQVLGQISMVLPGETRKLFDTNGNTVGRMRLIED